MPREFMPILQRPDYHLPWALIEPHAAQAMRNHGQTLERLAERGGLGFSEAYCVLNDLGLHTFKHDDSAQHNCRVWLDWAIGAHAAGSGLPPPLPVGVSVAHGQPKTPSDADGAAG